MAMSRNRTTAVALAKYPCSPPRSAGTMQSVEEVLASRRSRYICIGGTEAGKKYIIIYWLELVEGLEKYFKTVIYKVIT